MSPRSVTRNVAGSDPEMQDGGMPEGGGRSFNIPNLVSRVQSFADLGPNWDSYGADPIDPAVIERAAHVAVLLGRMQAAPCADGSVSFEGHSGDGDSLIVSIEPDRATLYVSCGDFEYEASLPDPADAGVTALARKASS